MHSDLVQSVIPLERYRELIGALASKNDTFNDSYWLRFSAQIVVLCPDSPPKLAFNIRSVATDLLTCTDWYQVLASPARFVVAAMLIQHRIPVADFITEHAHVTAMMNEIGLRHSRFHEIITVIIIMMTPGHRSSSILEIERIKAIYVQMKGYHWWLTGPDDLPACAALAQCPGSPELLGDRVEDAYQQLLEAGIPVGEHLQTAANLLPLSGLDIGPTVRRFKNLIATFKERKGVLTESNYDPMAMLSLLDLEPELVIDRLLAVAGELDLFQPDGHGESNMLIACDLTFLDLVRGNQQHATLSESHPTPHVLDSLHAFHLASAVLVSQMKFDLFQLNGLNGVPQWPYP